MYIYIKGTLNTSKTEVVEGRRSLAVNRTSFQNHQLKSGKYRVEVKKANVDESRSTCSRGFEEIWQESLINSGD